MLVSGFAIYLDARVSNTGVYYNNELHTAPPVRGFPLILNCICYNKANLQLCMLNSNI